MEPGGTSAAGNYLAELLQRDKYRAKWIKYGARRRSSINQAAVAQVLSAYLWESGEAPDTDLDLPRRLKDRVSRALSGRGLSPAVLRLFIEAFGFSHAEAMQLWDLLLDARPGQLAIPQPGADLSVSSDGLPGYETISLHEFHKIGPDRRPVENRTIQVIRATAPMTFYRYRFDTATAAVQVVRGGVAGPVRPTSQPDLFAVDIMYPHPLQRGDTASLEYRTIFAYAAPPEPVFRRFSQRRAANVELHLSFAEETLPAAVYWCRWNDYRDEQPSHRSRVRVGKDRSVHRYLDELVGSGAGFIWEW